MELDCYNEELRLAVEYNGKQHYVYDKQRPAFGMKEADFDKMVKRDKLKKQLCEKHGVRLIVVPYTVRDIPTYIDNKLAMLKSSCGSSSSSSSR